MTPEIIFNDPPDDDNQEANNEEIEDSVDTDTSPSRSIPMNALEDTDHANFNALLTIPHEDNGAQEDEDDNRQQDNGAIQVPVIQHDGCCTPQTSPPPTQSRPGGRSLPGRSIENRSLNINIPHPGNSGSIPGRVVHTGDVIRYVTEDAHEDHHIWLQATVRKMYKTVQRLHPTYYNIVNERGEEISLELLPGNQGWQVLTEGTWQFVGDWERRPA